jgi:hypothetical protein
MTAVNAPEIIEGQFQQHQNLLLTTITDQAGSLEKALLEQCMNGIEAGASEIQVEVDADITKLSISDNGRGITNWEELNERWLWFGTPHEKDEQKIWAQFRMGRGQCFSYGQNIWRTGPFQMEVDILNKGLDYRVIKNLSHSQGCQVSINLYKQRVEDYQNRGLDNLKRLFKALVEFMPAPIFFNGEQINTPAVDLEFTCEDEDAYYLFGPGNDLTIYNLGAHCKTLAAWQAGVTGVIISKQRLSVNMARNDIKNDCKIFKRIQKVIHKNKVNRTRTRKTLSREEIISTLCDLRDGMQKYADCRNMSLIWTSSGNRVSLHNVRQNTLSWSFASRGDTWADRLMQSDKALVFDKEILDALDYSGAEKDFFTWLIENAVSEYGSGDREMQKWAHVTSLYVPYSKLEDNISRSTTILPESKLSSGEKRLLRILNNRPEYFEGRRIIIGISDTYEAWTDGSTYIALDREFIKGRGKPSNSYGAVLLFAVLAHECAHDEQTDRTHVHGPEFYERYHEITISDYSRNPLIMIPTVYEKLKNETRWEASQNRIKQSEKAHAQVRKALGTEAALGRSKGG